MNEYMIKKMLLEKAEQFVTDINLVKIIIGEKNSEFLLSEILTKVMCLYYYDGNIENEVRVLNINKDMLMSIIDNLCNVLAYFIAPIAGGKKHYESEMKENIMDALEHYIKEHRKHKDCDGHCIHDKRTFH